MFYLFLVLFHFVRVGVPFFTGRQPSQNGPRLFFPLFQASCRSVRVGVPFFAGREPSQNGQCPFFFFRLTFNISAVRAIQNEVS